MEEPEEAEPTSDSPPLVMSIEEFQETIEKAFIDKFGRFNPADPLHARLRRKLQASAQGFEENESTVVMQGEAARLLRRWLEEHRR